MPRVYLTEKDELCARLARYVYGEKEIRRLSLEDIASEMGITHQALSKKLRSESFDYYDFCFFVKKFQPTQRELLELIGYYTKGENI